MATRGNLDRLSSFPDDILSHILTFIPMKAAVQTSVLSRRWRYLFASMSTLDLDNIMYRENVIGVKNFVYMLLHSSNQRSLECFRVTNVPEAYRDCISHWVYFALRRGVKEIDLRLPRLDHIDEIVTRLFTCQSLVKLELTLELGYDIKVPCTVCLPNLKSFHLGNLVVTDDSIRRLISSCCVLEDFVLDVSGCEFYKTSEINIQSLSLKTLVLEFDEIGGYGLDYVGLGLGYVMVINAPSLVHFEYDAYIAEDYTISNMTSLIKAKISICCVGDVNREQSFIRLLQGICNVRSLYLSIDDDNDTLFQTRIDPVLAFHNLVELEFHSDRNNWIGTRLVEFLHFVPNLKTLILRLAVVKRKFIFPHEVPSCLSSHLKEITISFFQGEHMFEMISYFLVNAMVLEKLRLGIETHDRSYPSLLDHDLSSRLRDHDLSSGLRDHDLSSSLRNYGLVYYTLLDHEHAYSSLLEQSSVFKKVLSLPRSSSTCQVLTF